MSRIGNKIKEVRVANRLSTEQFQKIMGYKSRTTVSKIETGVNDISYEQLLKFCKHFNVDMNELLDNNYSYVDLSEFTIGNQELRPIDDKTFYEVCQLEVAENQKEYVAENVMSLAEAYLFKMKGTFVLPIGVYRNRKPIGFAMITKGDIGAEVNEKYNDGYCMLRIMIDKKYQGKGYGQLLMTQLIKCIESISKSENSLIWISTDKDNSGGVNYYKKSGFEETVDTCGNEIIMVYRWA